MGTSELPYRLEWLRPYARSPGIRWIMMCEILHELCHQGLKMLEGEQKLNIFLVCFSFAFVCLFCLFFFFFFSFNFFSLGYTCSGLLSLDSNLSAKILGIETHLGTTNFYCNLLESPLQDRCRSKFAKMRSASVDKSRAFQRSSKATSKWLFNNILPHFRKISTFTSSSS